MKAVSLFCGAGGFDIALRQAGFDILLAVDIDKYAIQSYNANIGGGTCEDICNLHGADLPYTDVWTGGFLAKTSRLRENVKVYMVIAAVYFLR